MSPPVFVALALAFAVLLGCVRTRQAGKFRSVRMALQCIAATALYFFLIPPTARESFSSGEIVVLTPGATSSQIVALPPVARVVALPGIDAPRNIERVPDLGTALRRYADTRRLRIVGAGVPPRDRDAAHGRVAEFDAVPLPRGLVEMEAPTSVRAGRIWRVDGRVEGALGGRVELRDPANAVVGSQDLDAQGRFTLRATAKGEGGTAFELSVLDRNGVRIDGAKVPFVVRAGKVLRVLMLAGAPDAELKFLRRWAVDAGLALDTHIAISDGVALTEGAFSWSADVLRGADLAIIDERAWAVLDASHKHELVDAVRGGLGLLLRATGPVPAAVTDDWAALGYRVKSIATPPPVAMGRVLGLDDSGTSFTRSALAVEAGDAAPMLRGDDGSPVAWVVNAGRGRVALWLLADSYRLRLGGAEAAYATLWADAFAAVARARGDVEPTLPSNARVDERAVLCNLTADAVVENDAGVRTPLVVDATRHCAAYWPDAAGWHSLVDGGDRWPFFVRTHEESAGLVAGDAARATRALLGGEPSSVAASAVRERPWPRWPFLLAWLVAVAGLWWLERSRADDGIREE
ncbi:MAG: hypothetical protein JSR65_11845 [Proteobacteria bacterium]|nr:hypothetical protein [Pseudomonadota bacterium]